MADIKFMDISENDNPATTDSILVGNKDNGLKRTTLGNLGKMFAVSKLIHIEVQQQPLVVNTDQYNFTAPDVEGYSFAFWLQTSTVSVIMPTYSEKPFSKSTSVFVTIQGDEYNTSIQSAQYPVIQAVAVYVKNEVA